MRIVEHPDADVYARLNPRYDGNCAMRADDGRCALQIELGENALPDICRLYPRGIRRVKEGLECSCANSCEAVLEMLYDLHDPLLFTDYKSSISIPKNPIGKHGFESLGRERKLRLFFIRIIQDRTMPLYMRILKLGAVLEALEPALRNSDVEAVDNILYEKRQFELIAELPIDGEHIKNGLFVMEELLKALNARSVSINEQGEEILQFFSRYENPLEPYNLVNENFVKLFPGWEIFFENMLANHMFFSLFPFQNRPESFTDELIALSGIYSTLRFLCLGWTINHPTKEDLIDISAAAFRLIDHTEFDRYAVRIMKKLGCGKPDTLYDLIRL